MTRSSYYIFITRAHTHNHMRAQACTFQKLHFAHSRIHHTELPEVNCYDFLHKCAKMPFVFYLLQCVLCFKKLAVRVFNVGKRDITTKPVDSLCLTYSLEENSWYYELIIIMQELWF